MKQYCRYCVNMICGNGNYCEIKEKCFSDNYIKHTNNCKDFEFCSTDALQENSRGYKPKQKKPVNTDQLSLFDNREEVVL